MVMIRARTILLEGLLLALPVAVSLAAFAPSPAHAQDFSAPPAAYVATTTPEYFAGRPNYWWDSHWYYLDGHRWNFYRDEPKTLRGVRGGWGNRPRYHYHR
jgi:hypothetical protein